MRVIFNLAIKAVLLLVFNQQGWLTVLDHGQPVNEWSWPVFGTAALIALVFTVAMWAVVWCWAWLTVLTFGFGVVLLAALPFLGYLLLRLVSAVMPGTLQLGGFWITALSGFLLLFVAIPASTNRRQTVDTW